MLYKKQIGNLGEDLAAKYLTNRGYKIIERNHWKPWGELDIVAVSSNKTLVFFEVKTLQNNLTTKSSNDLIQAEENLTSAKLKKLKRTASVYANSNPNVVNDDRGWQIDLLAIDVFQDNTFNIRHYENV